MQSSTFFVSAHVPHAHRRLIILLSRLLVTRFHRSLRYDGVNGEWWLRFTKHLGIVFIVRLNLNFLHLSGWRRNSPRGTGAPSQGAQPSSWGIVAWIGWLYRTRVAGRRRNPCRGTAAPSQGAQPSPWGTVSETGWLNDTGVAGSGQLCGITRGSLRRRQGAWRMTSYSVNASRQVLEWSDSISKGISSWVALESLSNRAHRREFSLCWIIHIIVLVNPTASNWIFYRMTPNGCSMVHWSWWIVKMAQSERMGLIANASGSIRFCTSRRRTTQKMADWGREMECCDRCFPLATGTRFAGQVSQVPLQDWVF